MEGNKEKQEIIIHMERLLNEVANVNSKFKLFRYITERRNDSLRELNIAPAFFSLVLDSLINNVIIILAKIYESYNRSGGSINKLLNKIEQNLENISDERITINTINKHRSEIEEVGGVIENLFIWRDKHCAHFDKKYFLGSNSLSEDAKLTYSDINKLIERAGEILNDYYSILNNAHYNIEALNFDDVSKIIDILKDYNIRVDNFIQQNKSRR
jgi:methyl-accepting chemotaxis protein